MASSTRKFPPLGEIQKDLLRSLREHGKWYPLGGWVWDTTSGTRRRLDGLVARGLVEKKVLHLKSKIADTPGFDQECYVLTPAGIAEERQITTERQAVIAARATR
jgi:hypothetical protein